MAIDVSAILTIYNKSEEVEDTVLALLDIFHKQKNSFEIVLCDDGSQDDSRSVCESLAGKYSTVKVTGYETNHGRGYALKKAFQICEGKKILYMDSDISKTTDLKKVISEALSILTQYPVVIGNRFDIGAKLKRNGLRNGISFLYLRLKSLILPEIQVTDCNVGFKGFRREIFEKFSTNCMEERFSFDIELIFLLSINHVPMIEIPMDWNELYPGYKSSVNLFMDSVREFMGFFRIRKRHNKLNITDFTR